MVDKDVTLVDSPKVDIQRAIKKRPNFREKEELVATTCLKECTNRIDQFLKEHQHPNHHREDIASEFPKTMSNVEDLQCPEVYCIPRTCGKVYLIQTGRHVSTRLKEHKSISRTTVSRNQQWH
ncbi:hypothetical protein NQ315_010089 [Exocentrus adspersus]|uniref:Uncharacterized protein n=1 Tax=Exocentrus adspersus TaxID=1586481 RepID=A0AAV8WB92_9CUCU|nr:hypothetical protein NQ315_010089 [Exocentrus adspersus]